MTFLWQGSAPHFYYLSTIPSPELITRSICWLDQNLKIQPRLRSPALAIALGTKPSILEYFGNIFGPTMTSFLTLQMLNLITKNAFSRDLSVPKVWTVSSRILQNQNSKSPLSYKADSGCESWKLKKMCFQAYWLKGLLFQRGELDTERQTQTELRTWLGRADVQSCGFTPGPGPAIQQCEIRKAWELWADCGLHNLFLPVLTVSLQCHQIGSWQQINLLIWLETSSRDPEIRSSGHKIHVGCKCWYKDLYLPSPPVYLCQD